MVSGWCRVASAPSGRHAIAATSARVRAPATRGTTGLGGRAKKEQKKNKKQRRQQLSGELEILGLHRLLHLRRKALRQQDARTLCSRIGVMVAGSMRCLGPIQSLKSRYGQGFKLDVRLDVARTDRDPIGLLLGSYWDPIGIYWE